MLFEQPCEHMVSPGQMLHYEGRETTKSNRLLFHRACVSIWCQRQNVEWHHFFLFRRRDLTIQWQDSNKNNLRSGPILAVLKHSL